MHGGGHHGPGPGHDNPLFHGFGFFGFLPSLLTLLVIIALIVAAVILIKKGRLGPIRLNRRGAGDAGSSRGWGLSRSAEDDAFNALRMRLAQGDITPEEYLERTSVLRSPADTTTGKASS